MRSGSMSLVFASLGKQIVRVTPKFLIFLRQSFSVLNRALILAQRFYLTKGDGEDSLNLFGTTAPNASLLIAAFQ